MCSEVWEMILHRHYSNKIIFIFCSSLNCSSMLPFVLLQDHAALCSQDSVVMYWRHCFWGLRVQAVRDNALKWWITTSEGLATKLQQRSAITCSWDSIESWLPPAPAVPEASISLGCWSSVLLETGQEDVDMSVWSVLVHFKVSVWIRAVCAPFIHLTIWEIFGSWIKD